MEQSVSYKKLPKGNTHKCFGCSPINPHGLGMNFFAGENSVISKIKVPEFMCGWSKLVHGGILSVILDEIMSWAVLHILKKIVLTKSMTIDYLKPVSVKNELKAEGKPVKLINRHEVLAQGIIYDPEGNVLAKSTGKFALLTPKIALRMGIVDESSLKGIERIIYG
jgi:uncharacterized protein (TIGR00369 family)